MVSFRVQQGAKRPKALPTKVRQKLLGKGLPKNGALRANPRHFGRIGLYYLSTGLENAPPAAHKLYIRPRERRRRRMRRSTSEWEKRDAKSAEEKNLMTTDKFTAICSSIGERIDPVFMHFLFRLRLLCFRFPYDGRGEERSLTDMRGNSPFKAFGCFFCLSAIYDRLDSLRVGHRRTTTFLERTN